MYLVEIQTNPLILSSKDSLHISLFYHQPATSTLSNNSNELIGRRQQGGSMLVVRGEVSKHEIAAGTDPTGLGRWNYVDLVNIINIINKTSVLLLHVTFNVNSLLLN